MTKPLTPEIKKQRAQDRKEILVKVREEKKTEITGLIKIYGSPYKASKKLKISPSAFYEQMERLGMKRNVNHLLKGEPENKYKKKLWFKKLLKNHSIPQLAKKMDRSPSAIRERLKRLGVGSPTK